MKATENRIKAKNKSDNTKSTPQTDKTTYARIQLSRGERESNRLPEGAEETLKRGGDLKAGSKRHGETAVTNSGHSNKL